MSNLCAEREFTTVLDRAAREKDAYDVADFRKQRRRLRGIFWYLYRSPNSVRLKAHWDSLIKNAVGGARVLEIGCGEGWDCRRFVDWGAKSVHGIDLSSVMLGAARQHETATLKFFEHDIHQPWPHRYDAIIGRGVLHHVDYQTVLTRLYKHNLEPGGQMVFMEPLGEGLLMRLYWRFGTRFHTPDERPFRKPDIGWLRSRFETFRMYPINYASIPASVLSWCLGIPAENPATQLADRIDCYLAARSQALHLRYRSAVFHITKPV